MVKPLKKLCKDCNLDVPALLTPDITDILAKMADETLLLAQGLIRSARNHAASSPVNTVRDGQYRNAVTSPSRRHRLRTSSRSASWRSRQPEKCFIHKLFNRTTIPIFASVEKKRELLFYKDYFNEFYSEQAAKVQKKILWTLRMIEDLERIPEIYFKHLDGTDSLYEARVQSGSDVFRILCFFDHNNLVVIGHGFQKKTRKTPAREIERGEKIKREYYEEKKLNKLK